ncbi:MAG TPA: ABC transporter ATP-binding protein [Phycisphaerae bacterium]|nr:ABC transporter ATP-binding protein [Phycisphaerae bacterium]
MTGDRPTPAAILIERLSFRYPDGVEALRDVTLRIEPGEKVALVGPNGSGKSTLLRHLTGLLTPTGGQVSVMGLPLTTDNLTKVRRSVGFVFQDADDQLFCPTVLEDVAFGPLHLGLSTDEVVRRVRDSLALVGLSGHERRVPQKLSSGEKTLVALATVLSYSADILVLDEPSASLDPRNRRRVMGVLARLDGTQLIATHDLDLAWDLCERTVLLADGRIIADGNTRELLTRRDLLETHGLELPLMLQGPAAEPTEPESHSRK